MTSLRRSRAAGFIIILAVYIAAAVVGVLVFRAVEAQSLLVRIFWADVAATVFVWLMGLIFQNASVYDPYWSVAPVVILVLLGIYMKSWHPGAVLLTAVVIIWGVRLTGHWSLTFHSLGEQDWRYDQLKAGNPRAFILINFFGIHLFPTLIVYLALIPAVQLLLHESQINAGMVIGALVSLFAVTVQAVSDRQMTLFRRKPENRGRINREGLWKTMRHPNYLGEILMWWGVYVMLLAAEPRLWFTLIGALANTLMFNFISVPLMERRQLKNKPDYADYMAEAGMFLPKLRKTAQKA